MVAAIADCHVRDQFNAYRSPNAVAAQGFWLFQESLSPQWRQRGEFCRQRHRTTRRGTGQTEAMPTRLAELLATADARSSEKGRGNCE